MRSRRSPSGPFEPGFETRQIQLTDDELTDATPTQTFLIEEALNENASFAIIGTGCVLPEDFTGGAAIVATLTVGTVGDPGAIGVFDILAGVNGQAPDIGGGAAPDLFLLATGIALPAERQLQALVTTDAAGGVAGLVTGDLTLNITLVQLS